ncbi:MAG: DinB family protein [Acidobacteriaceae bacterium]
MNCRTIRVLGMAAALFAGGIMMQATAQAQTGAAHKAKMKAEDAAGGMQSPSELYGKMLKMLSSEVISAAEAMPADKYDFAPTAGKFDGVRTFGSQVQHIAESNYYFFSAFGLSGAPDDAKLKSLKSKDELVQALKDSYEYAQKGIDTITPQNAFEPVSAGQMKMGRAGFATVCLAHSMDHYGQMVEYLRMNGIVPPASQKQGQGGGM